MKPITLVLLPGIDGTEIFFQPLLAVLPKWIRPIVVTYPAMKSDGYGEIIYLAEAAVRDLDRFYVLGWSFSGPVALALAAAMPAKVLGVVLCASFVQSPIKSLARMRFVFTAPVVALLRAMRRGLLRLSKDSSELLLRDKALTWERVSSPVLAARVRTALAVDARQNLRSCRRPILYLAGSRDRVVPRYNAVEIANGFNSTKVVTIDGAHMALYTNPAAAVDAIVEFVGETERTVDRSKAWDADLSAQSLANATVHR